MLKPSLAVLARLATPALAENEVLFTAGLWQNVLIDHGGGAFSCATESTNDDGTVFRYESWPGGTAAISVSNPDWAFEAESADAIFSICVDDLDRWNVNGQKFGSTITSTIDRGDSAAERLLDEIFDGTVVNIENARNVMIAQFSLDGWPASIELHNACEFHISE